MSCPKNPFLFLWIIPMQGPCDFEDISLRASGVEGTFHVKQKCSKCSSKRELNFVSSQHLMSIGYDIQKLNSMSFFDRFSKNPEDLK